MSFKVHEMWSVICDWDGCEADACEGGEWVCWADKGQAMDDAQCNSDWTKFEDGRIYCFEHWHWCVKVDGDLTRGPGTGCCEVVRP